MKVSSRSTKSCSSVRVSSSGSRSDAIRMAKMLNALAAYDVKSCSACKGLIPDGTAVVPKRAACTCTGPEAVEGR